MTDWAKATALHRSIKDLTLEISEAYNRAVEFEIERSGGPVSMGGLITEIRHICGGLQATDIMAGETVVARVRVVAEVDPPTMRILIDRYPDIEGKQ